MYGLDFHVRGEHAMCLRRALVSCGIGLIFFIPHSVQSNPTGPVIALHAKGHTSKGGTVCGTWAPNDIDCMEFNTRGTTGAAYDIYVVGVNPNPVLGDSLPTVAGVRWAIDYDGAPQHGVDVFSWIMCGDLEFPMDGWPSPKLGNTLTWDFRECKTTWPGESGGQAVAGAFYIYAYSDDIFSVTPWFGWELDSLGAWESWMDPVLELANCRGSGYYLDLERARGAVRFSSAGTLVGFNPCSGEGELPPYVVPDPPVPPPPPPPPTGNHPPAILLHVAPAAPRAGSCADAPADIDSVRTSAPIEVAGSEYDVFLLATPEVPHDPVGIAGIRMGIEYSAGLQVLSWISCGSQLITGGWPASGTGNSLIFDGCQSGEIEVGGYFRVAIYDPSLFRIIGHPVEGVASWADCRDVQVFQNLDAARVGWISMGGAAIGQDKDGCNPALEPCSPDLVRGWPTTWGKLKSKYR